MAKWIVNDWYQIEWNGKKLTGGDTFSGNEDDVAAQGLRQFVSLVSEDPEPEPEEEPAKPKPKAKPAASNKARKASPNK